MTENGRNTNRLDAIGYEAIREATIFDSASRQTARMVVPLSFTAVEESPASFTSDEESPNDYRTNVMPRIEDDSLETDESYTHRNGTRLGPLIASEPKRKSFLRYFGLTFMFVFILSAGAAGGFALAQYQKQKEEKGIAVLPAVKTVKGLPELVIEPYEDPNEIAQAETKETGEITEPERTTEQEEAQPNTAPSPTPKISSTKKEKSPNTQQNTNSNKSSVEELKVTQPKRPTTTNSNQQKQPQQKSRSTADSAREQLKKIGRRIKDIFSGN